MHECCKTQPFLFVCPPFMLPLVPLKPSSPEETVSLVVSKQGASLDRDTLLTAPHALPALPLHRPCRGGGDGGPGRVQARRLHAHLP